MIARLKQRWRAWKRYRRFGPAHRIYFGDGIMREECFHRVILIREEKTSEIARKLDHVLAWIDRPENGCLGQFWIGFSFTFHFEDPETAFLVKMRWG